VDTPAANGSTPLVLAVHSGHGHLAAFLLEHGANPNVRLERGSPGRRSSEDWVLKARYESATPFWFAAHYREPEIMRLLVDAGADPRLTTLETLDRVSERAGGVGPTRAVGGLVPPLIAALQGASDRARFVMSRPDPGREAQLAVETIKVAVELGADVNAADMRGSRAPHSTPGTAPAGRRSPSRRPPRDVWGWWE